MIERQAPPAVLFKYLKKDMYERYLGQGNVRLGVSTFYRKQYESGSGFADVADGVRSASFPSIGQSARTANRHFLFCFSCSYSYSAHVLWLQRKDCEYDLCVAFDGPAVMTALVQATRATLGSRLMACGECEYGDHCNQIGALRGNLISDPFVKPESYAEEDEYRLAVALNGQDQEAPLDLFIPALPLAIQHVIRIKRP